MHENFKLPLTRQKKKIKLGTISGIDQFGACIKVWYLYQKSHNSRAMPPDYMNILKNILNGVLLLCRHFYCVNLKEMIELRGEC